MIVLAQRIAVLVAVAGLVGGGSLIFSNNTRGMVQEQRITRLEDSMAKVPDIDRNVLILSGKIDVMNQKLDDAKQAILVTAATDHTQVSANAAKSK